MLVESLGKMALRLREERLKVRNPGKDIKLDEDIEDNREHVDNIKEYTNDIEKELVELKKNEPTSDNQFFRICIILYELGYMTRSIVYRERFKNDDKGRRIHIANAKLDIADMITQIHMLCLSLGLDFDELRRLGVQHLKERQKDFERDGWGEIGGKEDNEKCEDGKEEKDDKKDAKEEKQ